jgi:hypothetical protein
MNLSNNPFSLNLTLMQLIFAIIMYSLITILFLIIGFKSNKAETLLNNLSDKIFKLFKK